MDRNKKELRPFQEEAMVHIIGHTEDTIRSFKRYIGQRNLNTPDGRVMV